MRVRCIGIGAFALLFGLVLVLLRGEPIVASDQGVFLSVAARILAGDHLYSEVIDNKDPLFFYTYAGALWLGGWRGPFLLDALWLAVAGVSIALAIRELRAPLAAVVAAFFMYPLALTAGWYGLGLSMLAGLAFAPLVPWCWLRARFAASGGVLGIVMLFKLNLAPVAAASLVPCVALGVPKRPRWRGLAFSAVGLSGTLLVAGLLLAVRGELRAYLDSIAYNVHYSNARIEADGPLGRVADHLDVPFRFFRDSGRWQVPATILVLATFLVGGLEAWRRGWLAETLLATAAGATLLLTIGVLALTAYWTEHLQMLAYAATLVGATLIAVAARLLGARIGTVVAAVFVVFALWASVKNDGGLEVSSAWSSPPISAGAIALERARLRFEANAQHVTYMVLGSNSENGHAAFIGDEFDLVCRWFQLYPFSLPEQFDETLACVKSKRPEFVLVTLGFFETPSDGSPWARFVLSSKELLDRHYELVEKEGPGFQVWRRNPAT
jgi:hypothetical protein